MGQQAERAAVDERVPDVALVVEDGAVHGGEPELVAVVADAGHHAVADAAGVQHPGGEPFVGEVRRTEAQHVGAGDRAGRHAEDVAHHAAHPGVGPAEGLEGRGVVVGLHLEGEVEVVGEGHDPGVVDERRAQPPR